MGFPYLTVVEEVWSSDNVSITLEQQWFLSNGSKPEGEEALKLWSIPLMFATSASVSSVAVVMSERRQTFKIPLSGSDGSEPWLKINAGQKALVRVSHTPTMTTRLQPAIRSKALGPEDRASLLLDAYALAKAGFAPLDSIVDLLRAFDTEDNSTVWSAVDGVLNGLDLLMEQVGGEAYDAFRTFVRKIVRNAFDRVGWSSSSSGVDGVEEGHTDKLMRVTILGLVEAFCADDEDILTECRRRFNAHWDQPSELPSEFK
eukprot:gene46421-62085_t